MADNKEARDEKLIEELYERLWWYTHEASDEEFDEKEVDAITRLLDVLEPVHDDQAFASGADAALKRFWERYGEEEEDAGLTEAAGASDAASPDLPGKDTVPPCPSPNRSGWKKRFLRLGIGLAACAVLLVSVNIGCYALKKKSFFEIVREEVGRTEITVTGNVEGVEKVTSQDSVECSSWKEAGELVGATLLEPENIPEGYDLVSLVVQDTDLRKVVSGRYEKKGGYFFRICINVYSQGFSKDMIQYDKEWKLIKEEENVEYYNLNDMYEAFFWDNNCTYYILSNENIEFLDKIIDDMKK